MSGPVETKWFWRRVITIAVLVAVHLSLAAVIWKLVDPMALKWIGLGLISFGMLAHTVYLTGATVTDWAKIVSAARGSGSINIGPAHVSSEATPEEAER